MSIANQKQEAFQELITKQLEVDGGPANLEIHAGVRTIPDGSTGTLPKRSSNPQGSLGEEKQHTSAKAITTKGLSELDEPSDGHKEDGILTELIDAEKQGIQDGVKEESTSATKQGVKVVAQLTVKVVSKLGEVDQNTTSLIGQSKLKNPSERANEQLERTHELEVSPENDDKLKTCGSLEETHKSNELLTLQLEEPRERSREPERKQEPNGPQANIQELKTSQEQAVKPKEQQKESQEKGILDKLTDVAKNGIAELAGEVFKSGVKVAGKAVEKLGDSAIESVEVSLSTAREYVKGLRNTAIASEQTGIPTIQEKPTTQTKFVSDQEAGTSKPRETQEEEEQSKLDGSLESQQKQEKSHTKYKKIETQETKRETTEINKQQVTAQASKEKQAGFKDRGLGDTLKEVGKDELVSEIVKSGTKPGDKVLANADTNSSKLTESGQEVERKSIATNSTKPAESAESQNGLSNPKQQSKSAESNVEQQQEPEGSQEEIKALNKQPETAPSSKEQQTGSKGKELGDRLEEVGKDEIISEDKEVVKSDANAAEKAVTKLGEDAIANTDPNSSKPTESGQKVDRKPKVPESLESLEPQEGQSKLKKPSIPAKGNIEPKQSPEAEVQTDTNQPLDAPLKLKESSNKTKESEEKQEPNRPQASTQDLKTSPGQAVKLKEPQNESKEKGMFGKMTDAIKNGVVDLTSEVCKSGAKVAGKAVEKLGESAIESADFTSSTARELGKGLRKAATAPEQAGTPKIQEKPTKPTEFISDQEVGTSKPRETPEKEDQSKRDGLLEGPQKQEKLKKKKPKKNPERPQDKTNVINKQLETAAASKEKQAGSKEKRLGDRFIEVGKDGLVSVGKEVVKSGAIVAGKAVIKLGDKVLANADTNSSKLTESGQEKNRKPIATNSAKPAESAKSQKGQSKPKQQSNSAESNVEQQQEPEGSQEKIKALNKQPETAPSSKEQQTESNDRGLGDSLKEVGKDGLVSEDKEVVKSDANVAGKAVTKLGDKVLANADTNSSKLAESGQDVDRKSIGTESAVQSPQSAHSQKGQLKPKQQSNPTEGNVEQDNSPEIKVKPGTYPPLEKLVVPKQAPTPEKHLDPGVPEKPTSNVMPPEGSNEPATQANTSGETRGELQDPYEIGSSFTVFCFVLFHLGMCFRHLNSSISK